MGLFSSSKSATSTNITDNRIGAEGGSVVNSGTIIDSSAVPTLGAVSVNVAMQSARTSRQALKQNSAISQKAIMANSDVAKTAITEFREFGVETLDFGERALNNVLDFGDNAIESIEEQQENNAVTIQSATDLALNAIKGISESTKSEGERTLKQLIMWGGLVLIAFFGATIFRGKK